MDLASPLQPGETLLVTSSRCFSLGVLDAAGGKQGKFIEREGQVTAVGGSSDSETLSSV